MAALQQPTPDPAPTAERLLQAARRSFATRGYAASSLDDIATDCGVRKQTLLYHYPSKEDLLDAVIARTVDELAAYLEGVVGVSPDPRAAIVDGLFRVDRARPELLEVIREILRLGPPASTRLMALAEPHLDRLAGSMPRHRVLGAAAIVLGMATEVEVLEALGVRSTLADLRRRRRHLSSYLDS